VLVSPSSSERLVLLVVAAFAALLASCSTVKPADKEFLAEPAMTFDSGGMAGAHEQHVLQNREASFGAGNAKGGGCGCN
jgi:hypothetical protein